MNRNSRVPFKIAAIFVVLALLATYGYRYANDLLLGGHFSPLTPGEVNVLGMDHIKGGYRIQIQERVAKLILGAGGKFGPGEMDERSLDSMPGTRKFIPIREMLKGLQGNVAGLSYFVQRMNDISDDSLPTQAPVWRTEDIQKAISGDAALLTKLVANLNAKLDGTPVDHVTKDAIENGIIVDVPVSMTILIGGEARTIVARVKQPYRPAFLAQVESRLAAKFANDKEAIAMEYAAVANQVMASPVRENIGDSLKRFAMGAAELSKEPQKILDSITTVVNDSQIIGAKYTSTDTPNGKRYTLVIALNDEGRRRLWQFTKDRLGDQLLFTVNGIALAAPFVQHGISSGEVEIGGLQEESLVQLAVETINGKKATTK